jgi:ubiquinone/menaquinone biosynthesis C-methylase UbiE
MAYREFVSLIHKSTSRDYVARVTQRDKADVAEMALKWDFDYWDGSRDTGYGGYNYDGRWKTVAAKMIDEYKIEPGMRILDIGCGKGFLLHDILQACPSVEVHGIDISGYAIERCLQTVRNNCKIGNAISLPFMDSTFDLVLSLNTLHNLYDYELDNALSEIERVSRGGKYICVESYRTEREKVNLMYWQLTCRQFKTPKEWEFCFERAGYHGDYECIYFE